MDPIRRRYEQIFLRETANAADGFTVGLDKKTYRDLFAFAPKGKEGQRKIP